MQRFQIPPLSNWQEFESLCREVWAEIFLDPMAQQNGRQGQPQNGVDVWGRINQSNRIFGIQCKGKDQLSDTKVTESELEKEVQKALNFTPAISKFILATTGKKDAAIEEYARNLSEKFEKEGKFSIQIYAWPDIVNHLTTDSPALNKFYSWITQSSNPNEEIFNYWKSKIHPEKMHVNANAIPNLSYNIKLRATFLDDLHSYLNTFAVDMDPARTPNVETKLSDAIANFNLVTEDLVKKFLNGATKISPLHQTYTYWVDDSHLPYHEKSFYIELHKWTIKGLLYELIKAANFVLDTYNQINKTTKADLIQFRESYQQGLGIMIGPIPPAYYPMYTEEELQSPMPYQGVETVMERIKIKLEEAE